MPNWNNLSDWAFLFDLQQICLILFQIRSLNPLFSMKNPFLLILLLSCFVFSFGQNSYTVTAIPYNPDPFVGGTPTGIVQDDVWGPRIPLPFSFCVYDSSYNELSIGSNGDVSFSYQTPGSFCPFYINNPMPGVDYPNHAFLGPMFDLFPNASTNINYDVQGVAPYRRFIISFFEVPFFDCQNILYSQQTIFYETTNVIESHILSKPSCTTTTGGQAIHGLQIYPYLGYDVPGRNSGMFWTATNDAWRFTPTGQCFGAPPTDSISGKVFADINSNCVQDPNEFPIMNRAIMANGGQFYEWTDANGNYDMGVAPGTYSISEYLTSPFLASSCNPGGVQTVTVNGQVVTGIDFPDSAAAYCSDLTVGIGAAFYRRCQNTTIHVVYSNQGTLPDSNAVVTVTLIDSLQILSSSQPYTVTGLNTYSFNLGILMPGQTGNISLLCHVGCDTAGTIYCISAGISGNAVDCNYYNNVDYDCMAITAPMDPNSKHVAAQNFSAMGYVALDYIDADDSLTYRIDFQNVGTSYAEDVVIRDVIDVTRLDLSTLQPGAASAPYNYLVNGNELLFRFEDIMLLDSNTNEPASHGFVKFRIHQRPGNAPGTDIQNEARIFFDFEAPIVTNISHNLIPIAAAVGTSMQTLGEVFPNPGSDQLVVRRFVANDLRFVLSDIAGKEVRRLQLSELQTVINTSDLDAGLYLYRFEAEGISIQAGKWVKQ
jgi:hypothetical protein